jgi:hypothetical protein
MISKTRSRLAGFCAAIFVLATPLTAQSPRPLTIRGVDFAFQVPDTVPAGPTIISLDNVGAAHHEVLIVRLKEGRTGADVLAAKTGPERMALQDGLVGLVAADPGSKSLGSLVTSLVAGRTYALICNIVDPPGKPSHMAQGMFRVVVAR